MNNTLVLVEEIWVKTDSDDASAIAQNGEKLKLVAYLIDGYPLKLDEGYFLERRYLTKEEADKLLSNK